MSSAAVVYFFLIESIVPVLADDRPISSGSIAALSILFGFIFLVIFLSILCYCVRKHKERSRRDRVEKLKEIKTVFAGHLGEYPTPPDNMVNEKTLKYNEWRRTQTMSTMNSAPVVLTQAPSRESRYMTRVTRGTRSISPTRTSPRTPVVMRGRSRQKFVYPSQTEFNTIQMKRSKSAPAVHRTQEYVPAYPNKQLFYTKSHYLAIKQPFSKKYLLPPVLTHYAERPALKRVVVPPPPQKVIVQPPPRVVAPPPPKREVITPRVYHVQYQPSSTTVVQRNHADIDEDFRLQTTGSHTYQNSYQQVTSYEEPIQSYRSYNEPIESTLINYKPRIIRPEPSVIRASGFDGGELKTSSWSSEPFYINSQFTSAPEGESAFQKTTTYTLDYNDGVKVSNGLEQTKTVADDFTIVDFVEDGQTTGYSGQNGTVTVVSSSSPTQAHNSSALNDLDNLLGDHNSSSSSSSSSGSK